MNFWVTSDPLEDYVVYFAKSLTGDSRSALGTKHQKPTMGHTLTTWTTKNTMKFRETPSSSAVHFFGLIKWPEKVLMWPPTIGFKKVALEIMF